MEMAKNYGVDSLFKCNKLNSSIEALYHNKLHEN